MTIAFSTKTLDWKTRYSFEPNQYMTSGDEMISFQIQNSLSAWQHDTGDYSKFYDTAYSPSFSVVSNEDPSATKIYEAFSIEGSDAPSSVSFSTRTADDQESSTSSFKKMEGKFYSDVPKNLSNIDAALGYVGNTTLGALRKVIAGESISIPLQGRPVRIPNGTLVIYPLSNSEASSYLLSIGYNGSAIVEYLSYYDGGKPVSFTSFTNGYLSDISEDVSNLIGSEFYVCKDYDPYTNSLYINDNNVLEYTLTNLEEALGSIVASEDIPNELIIPLFTFNDPSLSGEDMRGDFMKMDLEFAAESYFEVYAINVDQHKTKLDHSLGQNN
jgi:hypothetical protein